jgi:hypothetical protein
VDAMSAVVFHRKEGTGTKAVLESEAIELGLSNVDVLIDVARAGRGYACPVFLYRMSYNSASGTGGFA